ncbi:MAG: hypothetical protein AB7R89_09920 [Dehalococcoidia bacterium]
MQTPDFDWDEFNIEHIAEHGVTPTEAEDAILDPDRMPSESRNTPSEKRQGLIGMTEMGDEFFENVSADADAGLPPPRARPTSA